MSLPLSWTFPNQGKRTDNDYATELVRSMVNGLRETGMKGEHAVALVASPSSLSPRKALSIFKADAFRVTPDELRLIQIGRRRIARWLTGWHLRRAEYWRQIAEEKKDAREAELERRQMTLPGGVWREPKTMKHAMAAYEQQLAA